MIAQLKRTLLGLHPQGTKYYASNVIPPATTAELMELWDLFHRVAPNMEMPTSPDKVQHWIYRVRDLTFTFVEHRDHRVALKVKVPSDRINSQRALAYVKEYYPMSTFA
jgi:hypothetical protein